MCRIKENKRKLCTWQLLFPLFASQPSAFWPLLLLFSWGLVFLFSFCRAHLCFLRLGERPGRSSFGHLLSSLPTSLFISSILPGHHSSALAFWPSGLARCWPRPPISQLAHPDGHSTICAPDGEIPLERDGEMYVREAAKRRKKTTPPPAKRDGAGQGRIRLLAGVSFKSCSSLSGSCSSKSTPYPS